MLSEPKRRKKVPSELPKSLNNPKPPSPDSPTHVSSNRQKPTIAPAVFMVLIVVLSLALLPIFYYTQVMIPNPDSTSILSQYRIKGNILLSALGHRSSEGPGRVPFSSESITKTEDKKSPEEIDNRLKKILDHLKKSIENRKTEGGDEGKVEDKEFKKIKVSEDDEEEQRRMEEELGRFWKASSEYRKKAQKEESGKYSIQGDGTRKENNQEDESKKSSIDDLPEADPDAKEGLTPEIWEAIKKTFSADDLTVMLDSARRKEAESAK